MHPRTTSPLRTDRESIHVVKIVGACYGLLGLAAGATVRFVALLIGGLILDVAHKPKRPVPRPLSMEAVVALLIVIGIFIVIAATVLFGSWWVGRWLKRRGSFLGYSSTFWRVLYWAMFAVGLIACAVLV